MVKMMMHHQIQNIMLKLFTLNIFLNDDFTGGETNRFSYTSEYKLCYSVKPQTGRASLFWANQYHKGNKVIEPFKYLLRTDVMGIKK